MSTIEGESRGTVELFFPVISYTYNRSGGEKTLHNVKNYTANVGSHILKIDVYDLLLSVFFLDFLVVAGFSFSSAFRSSLASFSETNKSS